MRWGISFTAVLLLECASASILYSATQTITVSHSYVLGDNDSRNDARHLCFLEAKRKVLEQAGSFIQSVSEVKNFDLTKDQIVSYSAALLSVEVLKEDFRFSNNQGVLTLTVKSDVDVGEVQKRLVAILGDKGLQGKIQGQQEQIRLLEQQVQALNSRLSVAPLSTTGELRKARTVVVGDLEELENKKLAAVRAITEKTDLIRQYIVRNMTMQEVKGILGTPRATNRQWLLMLGASATSWNYGERWVCFDASDLVRATGSSDKCDLQ